MSDFGIRFFLCNIYLCVITGIFLITKRTFQKYLTGRIQFHLWFLLLGLLAVLFLPFRLTGAVQFFPWSGVLRNAASPDLDALREVSAGMAVSGVINQLDDFALSVSSGIPSIVGLILCVVWAAGVTAMLLLTARSAYRLNILKKSALPLQSETVQGLYQDCLRQLHIRRDIPVYSTAFLRSPMIAGLFSPRIYLPIRLISEFCAGADGGTHVSDVMDACRNHRLYAGTDGGAHSKMPDTESPRPLQLRYILLHELQHYRHADALAGFFMNLAGILYWCNPFVRLALKEMRDDREIACDASVLKLLVPSDYEEYGNTLISFAEKVSLSPFPFAVGISGNMRQLERRILHISSYRKPSFVIKLKGFAVFTAAGILLSGTVPFLSACAAGEDRYLWPVSPDKVTEIDLTDCFDGYDGSFVLYDLKSDTWQIYNMDQALLRTPPNSTYKIYDALLGLEEGVITPEDSFMAWDKTQYPFDAWNRNQDLTSAMGASVNWYFQNMDRQIGLSSVRRYVREIGYGNKDISADLSSYWMQSTLKISPVEQVKLLTDLCQNHFAFRPENIAAVKDSICLYSSGDSSSENRKFYGKTGTGRVNGKDVNGWFIGFLENSGNTCFFAVNIQGEDGADGSKAAEIAGAALSHALPDK